MTTTSPGLARRRGPSCSGAACRSRPAPTMEPYAGRSPPSRVNVYSTTAWISYSCAGSGASIAARWPSALISPALRSSAISAGDFFARSSSTIVVRVLDGRARRVLAASAFMNDRPRVSESCCGEVGVGEVGERVERGVGLRRRASRRTRRARRTTRALTPTCARRTRSRGGGRSRTPCAGRSGVRKSVLVARAALARPSRTRRRARRSS